MLKLSKTITELTNNNLLFVCKSKTNFCVRTLSLTQFSSFFRANQWTGFYMIGTSAMKELNTYIQIILNVCGGNNCFWVFKIKMGDDSTLTLNFN